MTLIRSAVAIEQIGEMPSFAPRSEFWANLKAAAREHFAAEASAGRPSVGDPRLQRSAILVVAWFAASYGLLLFAPALPIALLATVSLALAASAIGFGIFHDANHRTLCRRPAANLLAARFCSVVLGPSRHLWVCKHGYHHRQPNVFGWDDDLETRGLLRLSPACAWNPRFRRQELKALLLYGLNTIEWVFWKDFHCVATARLNKWQTVEMSKRDRAEFFVCKGLYLFLFVAPPFLLLPFTWAAASFILFHLLFSWVLAAVFQVAHLTPEMEFNGVQRGDDWAIHQIRTSANFATRSRLATWFTGGLNHQIEHHLFPNVAHSHYSKLRPIVRQVAQRHGLECRDLGSFPSALRQHFALLRALGVN